MNNNNITILLIFFSTLIISCKKDYPKDIPNWVKEKIKYCDKKKNNCGKVEKLVIDEWSHKDKLYYNLYIEYPIPRLNDFYDYDGNLVCSDPMLNGCNYFSNTPRLFVRRIWKEK
jgi:hypothetical protein